MVVYVENGYIIRTYVYVQHKIAKELLGKDGKIKFLTFGSQFTGMISVF